MTDEEVADFMANVNTIVANIWRTAYDSGYQVGYQAGHGDGYIKGQFYPERL